MYQTKTFSLLAVILVLLSLPVFSNAQDMPRTVVGSAGDYYDNLQFGTIHFTVGEVAVDRYTNATMELGEGFHRAYYELIVNSEDMLPTDWQVGIYPNPTTEEIRLQLPTDEPVTAQLYNAAGQLLFTQEELQNQSALDLRSLPAGTYILRLLDSTGRQGSFQVLKIKY